MLEISEEFKSYIEQPAQKVTPRVSVRFSDNRYLENINVKSSEDIYYNYLTSLDPKLYWRFFNENYVTSFTLFNVPFIRNIISDYSNNNNDAVVAVTSGPSSSDGPEWDLLKTSLIDSKVDIKNYKLNFFVDDFNRDLKNNLGAFTTPSGDRVYYETTSNGGWWSTSNDPTGAACFTQTSFVPPSLPSLHPAALRRPLSPQVSVVETGGSDGEVSCYFGRRDPDQNFEFSGCPEANQGIVARYVDQEHFVMLELQYDNNTDVNNHRLRLAYVEYDPAYLGGKWERPIPNAFPTSPNPSQYPNARMPSFVDKITLKFVGNTYTVKVNDNVVDTILSGGSEFKINSNATKHGIGVSFRQSFTPAQQSKRGFNTGNVDGLRLFWSNLSINCFESKDYALKLFSSHVVQTTSKLNNLNTDNKFHIFLSFNFKNSNNNNLIFQKLLSPFSDPATPANWNINLDQINNNLRLTAQVVDALGQNPQSLATTFIGANFDEISEGWRLVELTGEAAYNSSADSTSVVLKIFIDKQLYATQTQSFSGKRSFRSDSSDVVQLMPGMIGEVDFLAIFDKIIASQDRDYFYDLYNKSYRDFLLSEFCASKNVFETNEEEIFLWSILEDKKNDNNIVKTNGYSHLLDKKEDNIFYPFISSNRSSNVLSSSGFAFAEPPEVYGAFDSVKCNKIKISTGYESSKIKRFELIVNDILIQNNNNNYFEFNIDESYKIINLPSNIFNVNSVKVKCLSTHYPNCPARLFNINMIYDVDVSEDVISLDYNKIRENFESTLPLGVTAANSGDIVLDNTHQKYSPYNASSPYHGLLQPEAKVSLALDYHLPSGIETVVLATDARVQSWDIDSGGMTVSAPLADDSTVLQDLTADEGFLFEGMAAGRAVTYIAKAAGVPSRKVKYWDSYQETVVHDSPAVYFPLNETLNLDFDFGSIGLLNVTPGTLGVVNVSAEGQLFGLVNGSFEVDGSPVLKQERGFDANIEARTLNSLYQISPELVGESVASTAKPVYNLLSRPPSASGTPPSVDLELAQYRNNPALFPPANFAFEFVFELSQMPQNESVLVSYLPACEIKLIKNNNLAKIQVDLYNNNILTSNELPIEAFLNQHTYVYLEIKNSVAKLYFYNEYISNIFITEQNFGTVNNNSIQNFPTFLTLYNNSTKNKTFYGKIAHFAIYTSLLSEEQIVKHATSTSLDKIYQFPYLYFFDATYWDGMLEWAAADLGMFYFDEFNNFNYEYKNVFHEPVLKRYADSQFSFNEEKHIISGSHVVDIQTNYINTVANPQSRLGNDVASVWRAEENDSLAITKLAVSAGASSSVLFVANTEKPIWPVSGYLKIDKEIIKYNNRGINKFLSLERGALGTKPEAHSPEALVREVKIYEIEFSEKPVYAVRPPFITAQLEEQRVDVDLFETTSLRAKLVLSAADDVSRNNPDQPETNLVILEGTNSLTELQYFTAIAGVPLSESTSQEKAEDNIEKINQNIKKFRKKELIIDNKFIQNKKYAEEISRFIVKYYGYPVPVLSLEVSACPFLQLGDVVTLQSFRNLNIVNEKYWVIENKTAYNGGVTSSLMLRKFTEEII